jgi:hypothetical protein
MRVFEGAIRVILIKGFRKSLWVLIKKAHGMYVIIQHLLRPMTRIDWVLLCLNFAGDVLP